MINYHPDDNLLAEFTSGSLAWALSLSVSAHVQLCPRCRQSVANLNDIGGALLNSSRAEPCAADNFAQLMQRIYQQEALPGSLVAAPEPNQHSGDPMLKQLPKVIAKLMAATPKLKWRRVSSTLKTARLTTGQNEYEVAFQRISSGGKVVEHDHGGLEVTLVLKGSFSDEDGIYSEGDFLVRNAGEVHRPTATLNQDCLCMSVVAAPVRVTGVLGRLINPFLSFRPS